MDFTTCSVCAIAASAGGAVGSYIAVGRCHRRRGRRALPGSRTMRAWPGGRRGDSASPGPPRHARSPRAGFSRRDGPGEGPPG